MEERRQTYRRTFEFDAELLKELNDQAHKEGMILEQWLPNAIKTILLSNSSKSDGQSGMKDLIPGQDFSLPFLSSDFSFSKSSEEYNYDLGNEELEQKSLVATSRKDLRGHFNRFLPVILCVRVVALYSQSMPLAIKDYYEFLRLHAYQVRLSLIERCRAHYRHRAPYDGLPAHRSEPKTNNPSTEESSWNRFVRYFAEVSHRPGSGGLAQLLNLITLDSKGNVVLTSDGLKLANLKNPVLDDFENYNREPHESPLGLEESKFIVEKIEQTHPNEYEKMGELILTLKGDGFARGDLMERLPLLNGIRSPAKKSVELNGLTNRAMDINLIWKYTKIDMEGDRRSSTMYKMIFDDYDFVALTATEGVFGPEAYDARVGNVLIEFKGTALGGDRVRDLQKKAASHRNNY